MVRSVMLKCGTSSLLILWTYLVSVDSSQWLESEITSSPGHYPPIYCRLTHVVLETRRAKFLYQGETGSDIKSKCNSHIDTIWPFQRFTDLGTVKCDRSFDKAYIFTIYYYYGSNYFHLHYDMMLPLYLVMHTGRKSPLMNVVLMPTVESSRMEILNWNTPAFEDPDAYWMQLLNTIRENGSLLPLDDSLLKSQETICFKTAYFGTSRFPFNDKRLVQNYVAFIKTQLDIAVDTKPDISQQHRIGIITRKNSRGRKILNEEELVKAISHLGTVDVVEFSGRSFKEQVFMVQKYSVLVGMNGAGLTNALYLPKTSVAVQLVPFNASLNFKEFGVWLSSRGPYLEWHNTHPEYTETDQYDVYNNRANTHVAVQEFVNLISEAVSLVETRRLREKTEL